MYYNKVNKYPRDRKMTRFELSNRPIRFLQSFAESRVQVTYLFLFFSYLISFICFIYLFVLFNHSLVCLVLFNPFSSIFYLTICLPYLSYLIIQFLFIYLSYSILHLSDLTICLIYFSIICFNHSIFFSSFVNLLSKSVV